MSEPIYERVMNDLSSLFAEPSYHDPNTTPEDTMSLAAIEQDIRNGIQDAVTHAEALAARVKAIAEEHLPTLAAEAAKAQASPIVQALEGAFLPPADEAVIAGLITKLAAYAAEHAPPADPALLGPDQPTPDVFTPAGPVVGGQAQ